MERIHLKAFPVDYLKVAELFARDILTECIQSEMPIGGDHSSIGLPPINNLSAAGIHMHEDIGRFVNAVLHGTASHHPKKLLSVRNRSNISYP